MDIFVGSLSFKTTEEELQKEFEAFGEVESVKIILDQETHRSRGFAFVSMPDREQATAAIAAINGKSVNGFSLKVNEARPRESRGPRMHERGSGTGYNSDRGGSGYSYNRPAGGGYDGNRPSGGYDSNRPSGGYGGGNRLDSNRSSYSPSGFGGGYGNRGGATGNNRNDSDVYDSKDRSGGRKRRGGPGPGGRQGGGKRSPY